MNCRSCENDNVVSIFSLGNMPLANRLLKHEQLKEIEPKYNLEIALCQNCGLAQLTDIVSPEVLFNEYLYFSSNSETMIQSAKKLVESLIPTLSNNALAIEIASNDGYLLQHYMKENIQVLGIEPAKNIADCALIKGIPTRCEYFSKNFAHSLTQEGIQADIIHANNVMAHVPNINDFVAGIKILLKTTGQAIIEVPYLLNLIKHSEFDTIYHEHVFYFSLLPLQALFKRHQLIIQHVEEIAIHGGSLRLFIRHENGNVSSEAVQKLISNEINLGITNVKYYYDFAHQISTLKEKLLTLLQNLKNQGHKIAAYGASAKGSTLLNFFGIGKNYLDFVVDRSPAKQNYYMSGTHIPIFHPDFLLSKKIPYTLLLTWNFSHEILMQQQNYRNQGGQFIIPIPKLEIV